MFRGLTYFLNLSLIFVLLFISPVKNETVKPEERTKLVIDNDAGGDDAMALFIALLYEKYFDGPEIVGLTTVHGNVIEEQSCLNNKRILHLAKRKEVPIYRGAKEALVHNILPDDYFGKDGLGDTNDTLPEFVSEVPNSVAALTLIDLSKKYEGNLVIVTLGPVTNIALALKLDPEFLGRLKQLYLGAGHLHSEKYPNAEYNVYMDVESYKVILENATPDKVTVLPYSQTKTFLDISKEWRNEVLGAIETDLIKAQNKFEKYYLQKNPLWFPLDPALIACALKEELIKEVKYSKQHTETCDDTRGLTTNKFVDERDANIRLIYSIHKEEYKKFLMDVFSVELQTQ